jgi:hypothetical protein
LPPFRKRKRASFLSIVFGQPEQSNWETGESSSILESFAFFARPMILMPLLRMRQMKYPIRINHLNKDESCKTVLVVLWLYPMASITLKDIPVELHAQLKNEATANFRSLTQEVMSRVERTFQIDAALNTKRDQRWIDEAIASGPETPLTKKEMDAIRKRILKRKK